ncbi:hypothetical protein HSRCO_1935 [Halanaeroarchaeum sp. HSR-CO]|uniref:hypothetical protein n=1 Tax=Halanaeroarchaeum sp. HSR-CO TaxID=2866382 RepID=UPI00217D94BA|nr:hypothetical protein [Halanaeroarchaeum sp. HSR-CO]UWG48213.1 hypothetical protein HSRCO_1935 [Halanaeroarchaeum sp. HSR-CO]
MRRTITILLVGALVAALAIGVVAPAVSAHGSTVTQPTTPYDDGENATETQAQYMTEWMETRMGPDGVESFEQQTGTTVEEVAAAMAEHMGPTDGTWNAPGDSQQYGPNAGPGYQAPGWCHGPMMPGGNGYGPGPWSGNGPGAGYGNGGAYGPGGHGPGMGGHMGGGMFGGW